MSRILIVLTDPPLPFGNAAARWYYVLIRGLVERGHDVTALASSTEPADADRVAELFPSARFDVRLYPPETRVGVGGKIATLRRPYSYLFGPELRRDLDAELARGCDVLHLEQTWCGWLGVEHAERALVNVLNLYAIDLSEAPTTSTVEQLRRRAVFRAERSLLRRYPTITTLTPRLTESVRRINPSATVHTVPLGMDLSLYLFEPNAADRPPTVGLIGSFGWQPTLSAGVRLLTRLWPEIKRRVPSARLQIVGRQARSALGELARGEDISLFEDVPDTIPYFRSTDVMLYAPGPASGMKVKVLEAFALGVPVVTTAEGVEGLPATDGVHAGIAEDDADLIERTVRLLLEPDRRLRQAREARSLLEAHCGPGPVLDRLERVYETIVSGCRVSGRRL